MNTIKARVTDLYYVEENKKPLVHVTARGLDGGRYNVNVTGTEPYLFVPESATVPSCEEVRYVEDGYTSYDGEPLRKVVTRVPDDVGEIRDVFNETYEADVPYERRVSVDYGLSGYIEIPEMKTKCGIGEINTDVEDLGEDGITPRLMLCDIETEPPDGTGDWDEYVENTPGRVLMITTYDSYTDEYLCLSIDEEDKIDPGVMRSYLEEHWEGHDNEEFYTDCNIRFRACDSEEELLKAFINEVKNKRPDLISGWNFTDFDWPYLLNRMQSGKGGDTLSGKYHALSDVGTVKPWQYEEAAPGLPAFDMMESYCETMSRGEWRSSSLDYVSGEELNSSKVEGDSIMDQYENDRSKLMAYNLVDVQLTVGLDEKHGIHEFFYQLSNICSCPVSDTGSEMRLVESFLFKHRNNSEILPTTQETEMDDATGGLVLNPSNGIYDWVGVLDLKSLYPSSIISLNISRETLQSDGEFNPRRDALCPDMPLNDDSVRGKKITEDDIDWSNGTGLSFKEEGLIPKYIGLLFDERQNFKELRDGFDSEAPEYEVFDNKQRGIKVVMNSFFGVSDNKYFRLSTEGMGDVITGSSRYVTWKGVQIAEDMGFEVLYGDTDSIFVQLADSSEDISKEEVVERGHELEERMNERMEEVADDFGIPEEHPFLDGSLHGTDQHLWTWESEKVMRRWMQTGSKKRYAGGPVWEEGQYLDDPEPSISGYEAVRSSSPTITEDFQEGMFKRILEGGDFEDVSGYVEEFADELEEGEKSIKEFGIPGVLNKPPSEYPNRPVPRACEYSNEYLDDDWGEGDNPWVTFTKDTPANLPDTGEIAVKWSDEGVPEGFTVDYKKHIEKHLKQPMEDILEVTDWSFGELRTGKRSQSAFDSSGSSGDPFSSGGEGSSPSDPFSD